MTAGRMGIIIIVVAIAVFLGSQVHALRRAPPLELASPPQGFTTSNTAVEIIGKTVPGARVEVNGAPLSASSDGKFQHLLVLGNGVNTITVSARKRYSRPAVIERQILILEGGTISQNIKGGI